MSVIALTRLLMLNYIWQRWHKVDLHIRPGHCLLLGYLLLGLHVLLQQRGHEWAGTRLARLRIDDVFVVRSLADQRNWLRRLNLWLMIRLQTVIVIGRSNCSSGRCIKDDVVCIGNNKFTGIREWCHFDKGRRWVWIIGIAHELGFCVFRFNIGIDNSGRSLLNMELAINKRGSSEDILNGCLNIIYKLISYLINYIQ